MPGEAGLGQFAHRSAGTTLLGAQCRVNSCTRLLHLQTLNQPTPVWFTYVGSPCKLPSHMHPCSQQLNYNPSSYHLHASFMAKFILCGRTHTLSYIPYCASCYFSGFLTDIYTPIHTPARPHNVLHSSSIMYFFSSCISTFHLGT